MEVLEGQVGTFLSVKATTIKTTFLDGAEGLLVAKVCPASVIPHSC